MDLTGASKHHVAAVDPPINVGFFWRVCSVIALRLPPGVHRAEYKRFHIGISVFAVYFEVGEYG
jgi:hypothetical protein